LPRLRFVHLPTPVETLPRLSQALGGVQILIKRDDQTGLAFGGNKSRKLEFLLAAAQAEGARTLITTGAAQSNHCRQTAAAAARFGFDCILVLAGEKPGSLSGNLLLNSLFGAQLEWAGSTDREVALSEILATAQRQGRRPFLIPYGGSNPLGASAYVLALGELLEQEIYPDWIVFASSSGGTQAGLVAGGQILGYRGRVLGISVDEPATVLQARVAVLAESTASLLGETIQFTADDILVNADYLGAGYGVMGEPEKEVIELFARLEGLLLDPVYTARAAAGLIDLARRGFFSPGQQVLFWHTGGGPALFADRYRDYLGTMAGGGESRV
jgi:D-cysteine desulfhydrase family pyridoxal phosphate-dependent enzyme